MDIKTYRIKVKEAYDVFDKALKPISSKYTVNEQKTFDKKLKEAEKVLEGKTSKFINELLIEGETAEELATKIVANNDLFETVYGKAEKQLRTTLKQLEEAINN